MNHFIKRLLRRWSEGRAVKRRHPGGGLGRVESLEERTLLSCLGVIGPDPGVPSEMRTIEVTGTDARELIEIRYNDDRTQVEVRGYDVDGRPCSAWAFFASQTTGIEVDARGGSDWILSRTFIGDTLVGGAGDDRIVAGIGPSRIEGGIGSDVLVAASPPGHGDTLLGGSGDDTLYGSFGHDRLYGGADNDCLTGRGGSDVLRGGSGHDLLDGDDQGVCPPLPDSPRDDGDSGTEVIIFDPPPGDDTLYGEAGNDTLYGGDGRDYISGGLDFDVILGGSDNDTLYGGGGHDIVSGEEGDDEIFGDYALRSSRWDGNDLLHGGEGDDTIRGGGGNDSLFGAAGYDRLFGQVGDDYLSGGFDGEQDQMVGGSGADTFLRHRLLSAWWWIEDQPDDLNYTEGDRVWDAYH